MPRSRRPSAVLTIRVPLELERRLAHEAHRHRRTRSETARAILEAALDTTPEDDAATEARRQSRLASGRPSEREVMKFVAATADLRGWR